MSSLTERERLERVPLKYELVVYRGRELLKRTIAIGELTAVMVDAHHLGAALDGTRVEYTRLAQMWPAPPANAPRWWLGAVGQQIGAGVTYELRIRQEPRAPDVALASEEYVL